MDARGSEDLVSGPTIQHSPFRHTRNHQGAGRRPDPSARIWELRGLLVRTTRLLGSRDQERRQQRGSPKECAQCAHSRPTRPAGTLGTLFQTGGRNRPDLAA